jgi:restriction system protein
MEKDLMLSEDIQNSFITLIKQLDEILPGLNQQASRLIEEQRYPEAGELISKAEKVVSLQTQIKTLQDAWHSLGVSAIESALLTEVDSQKEMQTLQKQFRAEPYSSYKEFRMPILQALVNLGGRATRQRVLMELEKIMADQLTENDWHTQPSNRKKIRWHNIASNARTHLYNEGLIMVDVKQGVWEITPEGRKVLEMSSMGE